MKNFWIQIRTTTMVVVVVMTITTMTMTTTPIQSKKFKERETSNNWCNFHIQYTFAYTMHNIFIVFVSSFWCICCCCCCLAACHHFVKRKKNSTKWNASLSGHTNTHTCSDPIVMEYTFEMQLPALSAIFLHTFLSVLLFVLYFSFLFCLCKAHAHTRYIFFL